MYLHMLFCEVKNWQGTKLHLDPNQFMLGTLTSLTCGVYLVCLWKRITWADSSSSRKAQDTGQTFEALLLTSYSILVLRF